MFRRFSGLTFAILMGLITWAIAPASGQERGADRATLKKDTHAYYEKGNYEKALQGFVLLSGKFPEEPMYRYYTGVCQVKLNRDLDEAVEHLYYASSRGVPEDAYYYLGMAYHNGYNFADAEKYFRTFERVATRSQAKELNIKKCIETSRSAASIARSYNPYSVLNVAFINLHDSIQYRQVKMRGGALSRKPDIFFSPGEDRSDLNSLMFMPEKLSKGEYVYFAGTSGSGREGSQLFRVRKRSGRIWGDPEPIKSLNTDGDELLPYFDPIENDVYFASNGREGMGGFDLYKSHYDVERDVWSEPLNLGFPVNSVNDDYLLLPGNDLGMVMFFSNRQGMDSSMTVYRVRLVEPKKPLSATDIRGMQKIAMLGGVAEMMLAEVESVEDKPGREAAVKKELMADKATDDRPLTITITEPAENEVYQATLSRAFKHQAAADSLSELATNARIRIRESNDPNDKWVWQKQIMVWERKAKSKQLQADEMYAMLHEGNERDQEVKHPETIAIDTVINDITVYKYTGTGSPASPKPEPVASEPQKALALKSEPYTPLKKEAKSKSTDGRIAGQSMSRFQILSASPYSASNPIPLDVSLPYGVFYRIQLGAFGKEIDQDVFGGISPVTGETVKDKGLTRYYAGKFISYSDASTALQKVRNNGYPDAFIVAYYNGQRTSSSKARALEK